MRTDGEDREARGRLARTRRLFVFAGAVYLSWWFAVHFLLPGSFNPLGSRLAVVAVFFAGAALMTWSPWVARHGVAVFSVAVCLLTLHYFYLLHGNGGRLDWVVGSYFCVVGVNACLQDRASMYAYNAFVLALAIALDVAVPSLRATLFLPGLVTLSLVFLVGLHFRLALLTRLERSTERFENLFNATLEGILLHDDGTIVQANTAAARLFGRSQTALVDEHIEQLVDFGGDAGAAILLRNSSLEGVAQRPNGEEIHLEVFSRSHVDEGRTLGLLALRDVTDRWRVEEERTRLIVAEAGRAAAEHEVQRREEFISIAAHELRTPLTSLTLNLERLVRKFEPIAATTPAFDAHSQLAACERQVQRLTRLTQDLLDASRLGLGKLELRPEGMDLRQVVDEVVTSLAEVCQAAGCEVRVESEGTTQMFGDSFRLEQLLTNLLRNACLYGKGRPVLLRIAGDAQGLKVSVRDQGIGIDPEDQRRIFERFERAVSTRNYGGLGLGLYIARQIALAHGGDLRVESTPGQGSTFTLALPRAGALGPSRMAQARQIDS